MPSNTFVVTGANRGIGLAYTNELLKRGNSVIATARDPSAATQLQQLKEQHSGKFELVPLDASNRKSVEDAATAVSKSDLGKDGIDVLINNAGVIHGPSVNGIFGSSDAVSDLQKQIEVNVYGVVHVTAAFLPLLRQNRNGKKTVVNISTTGASFGFGLGKTNITSTYAISKAAQNMLTLKQSAELADEGFTVVALSPGVVETDMTGVVAAGFGDSNPFEGLETLTPQQAAEQGVNFVSTLEPEHNGRFFSYNGHEEPW
ncbi:hypothetical protein ACM66B_006812 [Microbotryomycetes sp. NB124-2]